MRRRQLGSLRSSGYQRIKRPRAQRVPAEAWADRLHTQISGLFRKLVDELEVLAVRTMKVHRGGRAAAAWLLCSRSGRSFPQARWSTTRAARLEIAMCRCGRALHFGKFENPGAGQFAGLFAHTRSANLPHQAIKESPSATEA